MGLLDGKKGLILNIANDRSIAAHIGDNAVCARNGRVRDVCVQRAEEAVRNAELGEVRVDVRAAQPRAALRPRRKRPDHFPPVDVRVVSRG